MMALRKSSYIQYGVKNELRLGTQPQLSLETKKLVPQDKKIGRLTIDERQRRIDNYREKRSRRVWEKRINYNCRKRVADKRLRIKGRFVSKAEALMLSGSSKDLNVPQVNEKFEFCEEDKYIKKVFNVIQYDKNTENQ